MYFYKTIIIRREWQTKLHCAVFSNSGTPNDDTFGWSRDKEGHKVLTLPATRAEYQSFWQSFPYFRRADAGHGMRIVTETVSGCNPVTGVMWETTIKRGIPNRSQRKHGITIIG